MPDSRWPGWVFRDSPEPDYRFSLANERTFLAWIRTSLAMLAGSVAVTGLDLDISSLLQHSLVAALVIMSVFCAASGWIRWARVEHAMRRGLQVPSAGFGIILVVILVVAALAVAAYEL